MEKYNLATTEHNVSSFFVDANGDIFSTKAEAEICGVEAELIADRLFVGSLDEWKKSLLLKYKKAKRKALKEQGNLIRKIAGEKGMKVNFDTCRISYGREINGKYFSVYFDTKEEVLEHLKSLSLKTLTAQNGNELEFCQFSIQGEHFIVVNDKDCNLNANYKIGKKAFLTSKRENLETITSFDQVVAAWESGAIRF